MPWQIFHHPHNGLGYGFSEALAQAGARHGVTLGGSSREDFNLSFSVASDWTEVGENRRIACELFGFAPRTLVVPAQVHGVGVAVVGPENAASGALSPETAIPDCDALVTNTRGLWLGITIADCLPVFCFDPVRRVIGLAHSGWRGTAGRIALRTLTAMTEAFDTEARDCLFAIGPGIGPDGYEVDARVHASFAPEDADAPGVFSPTRPDHWSLDLTAAVVHQLETAGVARNQIDVSPWRTHRDTALFFSHRLHPGCPRMGAFLGMV